MVYYGIHLLWSTMVYIYCGLLWYTSTMVYYGIPLLWSTMAHTVRASLLGTVPNIFLLQKEKECTIHESIIIPFTGQMNRYCRRSPMVHTDRSFSLLGIFLFTKKSNRKYKKSAHDTEGMIIFAQLSGTDISTQADRWRCWEEKARLLRGH